jgi:tRNA(Ile2) C34 agmatinyltransferase TiaS
MSKEFKTITAFAGVFEQRLDLTKKSLKQELEKAKGERRRDLIKKMIGEIKDLQQTLREIKPRCPHCGGEL